MTTIDCPQTTDRQPLALSLAAALVAKTSALLRAVRNRREMYHLGEMSDVELADIGLRRGDLFAVSDLPLAADPTGRLSTIAASRIREDAARRHA